MSIGERLRQLRVQKGFSQKDIQKTAGLLRCYISRIENGYTVPSLATLERFAVALDLPLYRLFYTGEVEFSTAPSLTPQKSLGERPAEAHYLLKLKEHVRRMAESDRAPLFDFAKKLAAR